MMPKTPKKMSFLENVLCRHCDILLPTYTHCYTICGSCGGRYVGYNILGIKVERDRYLIVFEGKPHVSAEEVSNFILTRYEAQRTHGTHTD